MRNLFLFLQKHRLFILFLFLMLVSITLTVQFNQYQRSVFINSANAITGRLFITTSSIKNYFLLSAQNEDLRNQIADLKTKMRESYYVDTVSAIHINDTIFKQQYAYIAAKVIDNSILSEQNYLTLDKGKRHGVEKGQGVICGDGVVGVVTDVSERFAVVMSVLNKRSAVSQKIGEGNYFGTLTWDGKSYRYAQLEGVNRFAEIKKGDKVRTSGYSINFPENVKVGKISSVLLEEGSNFFTIEVELSTNFANLHSVYIIQNLFKQELESISKNPQQQNNEK